MLTFMERREVVNPYFILLLLVIVVVSLFLFYFQKIARNEHLKPQKDYHGLHVQTSHGWRSLLTHGLSISCIRDKNVKSIVQLCIWGARHNIVYTPASIRAFASLRPSIVDFVSIKWMILNRTFGVPSSCEEAFTTVADKLDSCIVKHLLQEPHMSDISRAAISNARKNVKDLITTSVDPNADKKPWERYASCAVRVSRDLGSVFEISLFPLVTSFMGHMTLPAIMGKDFIANSPSAVEDIELLDNGFLGITIGLPRWFSIPSLKRAYEARDRLHHGLASLYSSLDRTTDGLDPGSAWRGSSDVSQLIKNFDGIWKSAGLSVSARAAAGLSLPWAVTINANNAVFWILLRICATPGLVERIRDETKALFQKISDEDESPYLDSEVASIGHSCPMLKACYLETLRLDGEIRSIRKVKKEACIPADEEAASSIMHKLSPGDYVHTFHHLHHRDPKFFPDPQAFKPERFLIRVENGFKIDQGTLRPYGAGFSMCKGKVIAERVILYTVAAILQDWEMEPANAAIGWKIPSHISTAGVCKPKEDVRVILRRRP